MDEGIIDSVLNNTATPEQARQVSKWFATVEGQKYLTLRVDADRELVDISDVDMRNIERVYQNIKAMIHQRKRRRMSWMVAAAVIPLFITTVWMVFLSSRIGVFLPTEYAEIVVENGERMQVILHDGSKVFLNSGTTFRYPTKFSLFKRKVYLEGQAYFDVEAKSSYPFIIDLNGVNVNVTGTSFDVEAYKDQDYIIVSLDEGQVNLESQQKSYDLQPEQQLIYDRSNYSVEFVDMSKRNASAWVDNIIDVEKAPIVQVLDKLSRWYDVEFNVKNSEVYEFSYTLRSEDVPIDTLLHEIEILSPVRFKRIGNKIDVTIK